MRMQLSAIPLFLLVAGSAAASCASGRCLEQDHLLLHIQRTQVRKSLVVEHLVNTAATCESSCTCWGRDAGGHTCGERIEWARGPHGPHHGDDAAASGLVLAEFPGVCTCTAPDGQDQELGPVTPASRPCEDTCECWGRLAEGSTCGDRIAWVAGPHGMHTGDLVAASALVRAEFPDRCACDDGAGSAESAVPAPTCSSTECACWNQDAGGASCGQRITWVAGPQGPHTGDMAAAVALVRAEFPAICICNAQAGTLQPTEEPTQPPTEEPSQPPAEEATQPPTEEPTEEPTQPPTEEPTQPPTEEPTQPPTEEPTQPPTEEPTQPPTQEPTQPPTQEPTQPPTQEPTQPPTQEPTQSPPENDLTGNFCVGPDKQWRCQAPCHLMAQPCIDAYGPGSDCWADPRGACGSQEPPPARSSGNFCVGPDKQWRCQTPCDLIAQPCIDAYGPGSDCWADPNGVCGGQDTPPTDGSGDVQPPDDSHDDVPSGGGDHSLPPRGLVVGTYIGARPAGLAPPSLSSVPSEVNMLMLSFARNSPTGDFTFYDPWLLRSLGIAADRARNPGRRYLISLGGDVRYGGLFEISIDVDDWVKRTADSVERIIKDAGADGFEMQWEGNTFDAKFGPAASQLLAAMKARGYITVIGPYYGGTSPYYAKLPLDNVDFINMQMFAKDIRDESSLSQHTERAIQEYPSDVRDEARRKMVFGLNSNHRHPSPPVGLEVLKGLASQGEGIAGVFTWDAEHSARTMSPPWCVEKLGAEILRGGSPDLTCSW